MLPNKPGPKPKPIDIDIAEELAAIQCTLPEIAAVFKLSNQALMLRMRQNPILKDAIERGRLRGKISLRRKQYKLADRSPIMAIWLGKQYLEQMDSPPIRAIEAGATNTLKKLSTDDLSKLRDIIQKADD